MGTERSTSRDSARCPRGKWRRQYKSLFNKKKRLKKITSTYAPIWQVLGVILEELTIKPVLVFLLLVSMTLEGLPCNISVNELHNRLYS